jgi:pentatricopeptide repeat protein
MSEKAWTALLNHLKRDQAKTELLLEILEWLDEEEKANHFHFVSVMSHVAKQGHWEEALGMLEEMKRIGMVPDQAAYNCALSACSKGKQLERCEQLLREMKEKGMEWDVYTFSSMIDAAKSCGKIDAAKKYFDDIPDKVTRNNPFIYGSMMSAYSKCSQWKEALEWFDQMRTKKIPRNTVVYNMAIHAALKLDKVDKALQLFEKMEHESIPRDAGSFHLAVTAASNAKKFEAVAGLYEKLEKTAKKRPDVTMKTKTLATVREAYKELKDETKVKQLDAIIAKGGADRTVTSEDWDLSGDLHLRTWACLSSTVSLRSLFLFPSAHSFRSFPLSHLLFYFCIAFVTDGDDSSEERTGQGD